MLSNRQTQAPSAEHVTVVGEATLEFEPDLVEVSVVIQRTDETAALAKANVDARCTAVIALARALEIESRDIRATELTLAPHREYRDGEHHPAGHSADRSITLKLRNLASFNKLITQLVEVPVDRIERIKTRLADRSLAEQTCLTQAIDDAKQKAASIARQFNARLGRVYSVVAMPKEESYHMGGAASRATYEDASFEPGLIAVEARIEATFFLDRASNY